MFVCLWVSVGGDDWKLKGEGGVMCVTEDYGLDGTANVGGHNLQSRSTNNAQRVCDSNAQL